MNTYAIIGAGQAGAWLARTLRKQDADARVVLLGDEVAAPYERPPLSKEVLKGEVAPDSTTVLSRPEADELRIELRLGERADAIDRAAHRVNCASGSDIGYDKLFLATGSRVRTLPLPGIPEDRVYCLRTVKDAQRLREGLERSRHILMIGGGWIGLEIAAAARGMDKRVTIVEMAPRLCARAAPAPVSDYLRDLHARHGVDIRTGTTAALQWTGTGIHADMGDGSPAIEADMVIVAIGIVPNVELAAACGLAVDNGIVVDEHGRTSDPAIYAAGDVTRHPSLYSGTRERLESWDNAQNQAIAVARAATGTDEPYADVPWFWSDQYDVNLQIVGLPPQDIEPMRRGDPAQGSCTWFFWRGAQLASAIAVNAPRDIRVAKKWMQARQFPKADAVLDATQKLQRLPVG